MKFNKILFVLLFCAIAQTEFVRGMEETALTPQEQLEVLTRKKLGEQESPVEAGAQPAAQSWRERLGGYMSSAAQTAKRKAQQFVAGKWSEQKKKTETMSPLAAASQVLGRAKGGNLAVMMGMTGPIEKTIAELVTQKSPLLQRIVEAGEGLPLTVSVGVFIAGYAIQKVFAHYHQKDITKQAAIDQVKSIISMQLADSLTYPTRSTKLHALMKQNEFLLPGGQDIDGILAQACSELSSEIAVIKPSDEQKKKELDINKAVAELRRLYGTKTLDEQIEEVKKGLGPILNALNNSKTQARLSMLRRLEHQKVVEESHPGTFEVTSSTKFYPEMTGEQQQGFKERKTAAEESVSLVKQQEAERQRFKELQQAQEAIANKPIWSTTIKSEEAAEAQ